MSTNSVFRTLGIALVAAGLTVAAFAGPLQDVAIVDDVDDRGATVYKLVNRGDRTVVANVELVIECGGEPTGKGPTEREYWVSASGSVDLGKTRPGSNCVRTYTIVDARYS